MRDIELYRHLLGLEAPWEVTRVELSVAESKVDVWADHGHRTVWPCPECSRDPTTYDHSDERAWQHLDSCQFLTYLHARPPRVNCPDHGVRQVRLPWAERAAGRGTAAAAGTLTSSDLCAVQRMRGGISCSTACLQAC